MAYLGILEKICDNLPDSLEPGTATYIYAASIYDTWCISDNKLEKNIAKRLVSLWQEELEVQMDDAYRNTKHQENRPERDDYYKKWIMNTYKSYSDNSGIQCALKDIWVKSYGIKNNWL